MKVPINKHKELTVSALTSRKYRGRAHKNQYDNEKVTTHSVKKADSINNSNNKDKDGKQMCEQCLAMVPISPGSLGKFGAHRRCIRNAIFPGAGKCFTHKAGLFLSSVLERGLYKESIILGSDRITIDKRICNPEHYVQVLWNYKGNNGFGLYVKSGQEGDMISFMDGEYKNLEQCQPNYIFKTAFQIPTGYEKPFSPYIDALQIPIAGRGVMSFANYSNNPNCERVDNFDKMNCRVWYQLTKFLQPNKDGSMHELTIAYGSGCNPTSTPTLSLEDRIPQDPTNKGLWPGHQLKQLRASPENDQNNDQNSYSQGHNEYDDMDLKIGEPMPDNSIENQQKLCILTFVERARSLTEEINSFSKDCLQDCKHFGFIELHDSFTRPMFLLKKRLRDGLGDFVNEKFHPVDV